MARIGFTYLSPKCSNLFLLSVFFAAGFYLTNFDQQLALVGNCLMGQHGQHGQDGQHSQDGQDGHDCASPVLIR